jgi:hypothetical protein
MDRRVTVHVGHFNGSQKTLLGWLDSGRTANLSTGGTATLVPMAEAAAATHTAFVTVATGRTYWLEYRQPVDFDSSLPASGTDGVLVHVSGSGSGSPDTGASLIDVRPADGISQETSTLPSGQSWTSPEGVTIAVAAVTASGAAVTVTTGQSSGGTTTEESGNAVSFDGWKGYSGAPGSYRASRVANSTATFRFSGRSVGWATRKGPTRGIAAVTIDGRRRGTVDTYSSRRRSFTRSYTGLRSGTHTNRDHGDRGPERRVQGRERGRGRVHRRQGQDRGDLHQGPLQHLGRGEGRRGQRRHLPGERQGRATSTFTFTGTEVDWITALGPGWGQARVLVDGVDQGTVDLYSPTWQYQAVRRYAGLAPGTHTIKVQVLGTRNASATGAKVVVDAFVVR